MLNGDLITKIIAFVRINDSSYMPNDEQLREDIIALIKEVHQESKFGVKLSDADAVDRSIVARTLKEGGQDAT